MDWHRLFGLLLTDFFTGSPFVVELEKDLSVQQQLLDVVIVRKLPGRFAERLPDGLDDLAAHNLLTFKSHQEALDGWALHELIGHYVSYRKLVRPAPKEMLPEADFRLYAVCSRYPHNLATDVPWAEQQPGVYECRWGSARIRVVVTRQLPEVPHNAPLHLFAAEAARVRYGQDHYHKRSVQTSTLLNRLWKKYQREGLTVPYTMEDFMQEDLIDRLKSATPQKRRKLLQGLSPAERRETLQGLPPEELLQALSLEQIEAHLRRLRPKASSAPDKGSSRRKGRKRPKD